ncbi:PrgI family protein [Nocardia aurantiaca]|uniref:PrgI family protein n=1 Tax=Nocardia aurantiaca TaxID=2675850 RepID=UPI0012B9FB07|nr:PrgI family protein [Nocardia aurantiaca]
MTTPVRIPADVDKSDRLIGLFNARHLVLLAITAVVLYGGWIATRALVSPVVFLAAATPIGVVVTVTILTTRDGLPADQLLRAAIAHRLRPRHLIDTPEPIAAAPRWVTDRATSGPRQPVPSAPPDAVVTLPESVAASSGGVGIVDLGADGLAVVAVAGTLNLALRTPVEQDSLVGQLAGWLHTLRQPVQILLRSTRLDLTAHLQGLHDAIGDMSPELAAAATDHADHLAELATEETLLHRRVLLVWREPVADPTAGSSTGTAVRALLGGRARAARGISAAARRAAESRLVRRLSEAAEMLAPLGITVTALRTCRPLQWSPSAATRPGWCRRRPTSPPATRSSPQAGSRASIRSRPRPWQGSGRSR